jgi:phytoene dehydrogenase-like protein
LDGTRDRPAGKPAENRSRRDGIRAGAVSGPWRSGPRDDAPAPERRQPPERRPVVEPEPLPVEPARRSPSVALWSAVGILAAFALVAAAFLFRPEPPAPEVATSAPVEAAPATTPAPAADPAAFAAVSTVRLRVGQAFPEAGQAAILAALAAAGLGDVRVELQPFAIATSRVGYYRAEDLAAAEALGRLAAEATGGGAIEPRDYSQLLPDAEPGRLDLWIGG